MKAIELVGHVDEEHTLQVAVPKELRPGQVRVVVFLPEPDDEEQFWEQMIAQDWITDLGDPGQDLYTIEDGSPVDTPS